MTASLGASVLVILAFFAVLCMMLMIAVHIESTLQPPRPHRRRIRVHSREQQARANASAPPGSTRARPPT